MAAAPITVYGIANCDTIRKARAWLAQHGVDYVFHDYRKQGVDPGLLDEFEQRLGWESLLNRRGTSWRKLPAATREGIDRERALAAMLDNPALIRRPLTVHASGIEIGFDAARYRQLFG